MMMGIYERNGDGMRLLGHKSGIQEAARSWKARKPSEGREVLTLDFSHLRLISDF